MSQVAASSPAVWAARYRARGPGPVGALRLHVAQTLVLVTVAEGEGLAPHPPRAGGLSGNLGSTPEHGRFANQNVTWGDPTFTAVLASGK